MAKLFKRLKTAVIIYLLNNVFLDVSGLAAMRKYFLENNRESAAKLGYLITLGQANNRLLAEAEARALAFLGVQQISIGIDSGVSEFELNSYQVYFTSIS